MDIGVNLYNIFDKENHLKPEFDKNLFDTLHSWDFGWELLELIDIESGDEEIKLLSRRFSPCQKMLYFFWFLDAQVVNGGFIQFYCNGYNQYLPPIIEGLKLINDKEVLNIVEIAEQQYLANKEMFLTQIKKEVIGPLYDELKEFGKCDQAYYKIHDRTMDLMEEYIREHVSEFVNLI